MQDTYISSCFDLLFSFWSKETTNLDNLKSMRVINHVNGVENYPIQLFSSHFHNKITSLNAIKVIVEH